MKPGFLYIAVLMTFSGGCTHNGKPNGSAQHRAVAKQLSPAMVVLSDWDSGAPPRRSLIEEALTLSEKSGRSANWLQAVRTGYCHVHNSKMDGRWVPVEYRLQSTAEPSTIQEGRMFDETFPFGYEACWGGETMTATKEEEVFVCPECVSARKRWLLENPKRRTDQPGPY